MHGFVNAQSFYYGTYQQFNKCEELEEDFIIGSYFDTFFNSQKIELLPQAILPEFLIHSRRINSMALVRERTIPTERPPPVGEVSANFCG
jgi:hypothetical protein